MNIRYDGRIIPVKSIEALINGNTTPVQHRAHGAVEQKRSSGQ
jgi:hypothetical protein